MHDVPRGRALPVSGARLRVLGEDQIWQGADGHLCVEAQIAQGSDGLPLGPTLATLVVKTNVIPDLVRKRPLT